MVLTIQIYSAKRELLYRACMPFTDNLPQVQVSDKQRRIHFVEMKTDEYRDFHLDIYCIRGTEVSLTGRVIQIMKGVKHHATLAEKNPAQHAGD